MKALTPHDKINLRAWITRCRGVGHNAALLLALPRKQIANVIYAITGRYAEDLRKEQPPAVKNRAVRPSDMSREQRRRVHGIRTAARLAR